MPESDAALVARARDGDESAYGELVRRHLGRAHALAFRILREREDARDVTQDAFVRAWRALPRFEGRSEFGTWLLRIVTNLALNRIRRDRLRAARPLEDVPEVQDPSAAIEQTGGALGRRIAAAINALPPVQRSVFILRFQEQLSVKETAERVGCSEGAVKASCFHAIRKLRAALAELADTVVPADVDEATSKELS
jgi:RNA polymerase sigma-70 factor (ECF subfamily)